MVRDHVKTHDIRTGSSYTFVIQSKAPIYKAKLVIAPYSSAMIDHASSFFRNFTKHKIYTYTQDSSLQSQFINKVKGTSLLQPLPINHHSSCLTWPYNHKTKRLTLFINRQSISTRPASRNLTKPRIYTHNIPATVTTHHKASNYHSITWLA